MENKIMGGIYGFALGDVIGYPYEGYKQSIIQKSAVKFMKKSNLYNKEGGNFSDETSLMLATMDSIAEIKNVDFENMMIKYSNWLFNGEYTVDKKSFAIRETVFNAINKYKNGLEIEFCGDDFEENSDVSAIIRILPICIYLYKKYGSEFYNDDEALYYLFGVTELTNKQDTNLVGIIYFACLISQLLQGNNFEEGLKNTNKFMEITFFEEECFKFFKNLININEVNKEDIISQNNIISVLECAVYAVFNTENFKEAIVKSIEFGEQTDTVGALTGALAGFLYGYKNIDKDLIDGIVGKNILDDIYKKFNEN